MDTLLEFPDGNKYTSTFSDILNYHNTSIIYISPLTR